MIHIQLMNDSLIQDVCAPSCVDAVFRVR